MVDLLLRGTPLKTWNRYSVLDKFCERENDRITEGVKKAYNENSERQKATLRIIKRIYAMAILSGGIRFSNIEELISEKEYICLTKSDYEDHSEKLKSVFKQTFDCGNTDIVPVLEPDLFGEYYFLQVFMELKNETERIACMDAAFQIDIRQTAIKLNRLREDYEDLIARKDEFNSLDRITISSKAKEIEDSAFANSSKLPSIVIPGNIKRIGKDSFRNCSSLNVLEIKEGLETIEHSAFLGCCNLKKLELPKSLRSIGENAFADCRLLEELTMQYGIKHINNAAFNNCSNLINFIIPESVATIGKFAFRYCKEIKSIDIPKSVRSVGAWAFADCFGLTEVVIRSKDLVAENDLFTGCGWLKSVIYPDGLKIEADTLTTSKKPSVVSFVKGNTVIKF